MTGETAERMYEMDQEINRIKKGSEHNSGPFFFGWILQNGRAEYFLWRSNAREFRIY